MSLNLFFFFCNSYFNLLYLKTSKCFFKSSQCFNVSKFSFSTTFPTLKLSLCFQNIGGGLNASGPMYIAMIALKTSSLTVYDFPSFASFSFQLCFPFTCFFSQLIQGIHCFILMQ